ncbi:hypothetical protein GGR20_002480 [Devosia subaequoris]|uniref:Uncharacterized protein n=1 Tax=Devosia subaequoris TaxID=395930 RepID=A0A7W6INE8_9HYPH|nr:hypothetical protein [Devosia subaequoris]MBB4052832.1 hypothetical protein [Devosia subaequoris]MCP1209983.1 hypothetical protein [Devosia subaequoris]
MFLLTKRISATLPLIWLLLGMMQMPWLIPLPAVLMLGFLTWRHRRILTQVGSAPLASDGFAKHVMVDDLLRLGGQMLISPLLYMAGAALVSPLAG